MEYVAPLPPKRKEDQVKRLPVVEKQKRVEREPVYVHGDGRFAALILNGAALSGGTVYETVQMAGELAPK